MKRVILLVCFACVTGLWFTACNDSKNTTTTTTTTKKAPQDNDVYIPSAYSFYVDSVKVIFKNVQTEAISVQLFFRGGAANYTKNQEGIEPITLQTVSQGGTVKFPYENFNSYLETYGIKMNDSSYYDFGAISMKCISKFWNKSWDLFSEVVNNPSFDEDYFNRVKNEQLLVLKGIKNSPEGFIRNVALSKAFENKNYFKQPWGTVESIEKLTIDDCKNYYSALLKQNKMVLVVIGNISEDDLKQKVRETLTQYETGRTIPRDTAQFRVPASTVIYEQKPIATNYIYGMVNVPPVNTREYFAMKLAMQMFSNKIDLELRSKRNLAYFPKADVVDLRVPYAYISYSTNDPNEAANIVIKELKNIKLYGFDQVEFRNQKSLFFTNFYMKQLNYQDLGYLLGSTEMQSSWQFTEQLIPLINSITLREVNEAMNKYIKGIRWNYLGYKDKLDEKIYLQPLN